MSAHRKITILGTMLLTVALLPTPTSVRGDEKPQENAALKYWLAFEGLPDSIRSSYVDFAYAMPMNGLLKPIPPQLVRGIEKYDYSLRMMHRGAAIPYCDWGVDPSEEGPFLQLPHVSHSRRLGIVALFRARLQFEDGKVNAAINDVVAVITMSRQVAQDGTMSSRLTSHALEHISQAVLASYLPRMNEELLNSLAERLNSLPSLPPLNDVIAAEVVIIDWIIKKSNVEGDQFLVNLYASLSGVDGEESKDFISNGGGKQKFIMHLNELRKMFLELPQLISLPSNQFRPRHIEFQKRVKQNPLGEFLVPDLASIRRTTAKYACWQALLQTAIDVQLQGKDALKHNPDPFGNGPFQMIEFPGGFMLSSKLRYPNGVPMSLTVGIRVSDQ